MERFARACLQVSAGDTIVVAFPDVGIKKLLAEYAGLEKA